MWGGALLELSHTGEKSPPPSEIHACMRGAFPAERSILAKEMKGRSSGHFPPRRMLSRTDVLPLATLVASGKGTVIPGGIQSTKTKAPSSGSAPGAPRYPPLAGLSPRTHEPRAFAAQGVQWV